MSQMLTQSQRKFNLDEVKAVGFSGTYGHYVTLDDDTRVAIGPELYNAIVEFDNDGWFPAPADDVLEDLADGHLLTNFRG